MKGRLVLALLFVLPLWAHANEPEIDALSALLHEFLANADDAVTHERFWAEDLVYTSSRGTRTNKAEIMAGFAADERGEPAPAPVYSAEDVDIRVYDDTAVVAFRLVATPPESSEGIPLLQYFNTGTFVKRDGQWKAVAWQATKIPRE